MCGVRFGIIVIAKSAHNPPKDEPQRHRDTEKEPPMNADRNA
jgi:hypothetical protein